MKSGSASSQKFGPEVFRAIDRIVNGTSTEADYRALFSTMDTSELVPLLYSEEIPASVVPKRKDLLYTLYRWLVPVLRLVISNTGDFQAVPKVFPLKLVIEVPEGNGCSTLASHFVQCLNRLLSGDTSTRGICFPIFISSSGRTAGLLPKDKTSRQEKSDNQIPILVFDGIINIEQVAPEIRSMITDFSASYPCFFFVHDRNEVKKLIKSETFCIKVEPFTDEEIVWIALIDNYIPRDEKSVQLAMDTVRPLLERGFNAKEILLTLGLSTGLLLRDHLDVAADLPVELVRHASKSIMSTHGRIDHFSSVPIHEIENYLLSRIYGQKDAIEQIVNSIAFIQYGLSSKSRAVYSFLFLGKTGTGKTELSLALSKALFGKEDIIRIDMGEYQSSHHVEKLFGAPQGYVGYGQQTRLVSELKKRKKGILLLDEIEKAHPDVHNVLLNILDYGKFSTGSGELIDMRGYIVIMTSNALVKEGGVRRNSIGFMQNAQTIDSSTKARQLLVENGYFSPEFVNRINSVVWFNDISEEVASKILHREFTDIVTSMEARGVKVTYSEEYFKRILSQRNPEFGGRDVIRKADILRMDIVSSLRKNPELKELHFGE